VGQAHDYSILKAVFPPEQEWFTELEVRLDLGYLGFEKDYKCQKLYIPHKKPKKSELTEEQKAQNKIVSSERIKVEHSIGGMKRYRILSERLRVHDFELYDDILSVCAGLWNFYLDAN
jgi:hypothetical protein